MMVLRRCTAALVVVAIVAGSWLQAAVPPASGPVPAPASAAGDLVLSIVTNLAANTATEYGTCLAKECAGLLPQLVAANINLYMPPCYADWINFGWMIWSAAAGAKHGKLPMYWDTDIGKIDIPINFTLLMDREGPGNHRLIGTEPTGEAPGLLASFWKAKIQMDHLGTAFMNYKELLTVWKPGHTVAGSDWVKTADLSDSGKDWIRTMDAQDELDKAGDRYDAVCTAPEDPAAWRATAQVNFHDPAIADQLQAVRTMLEQIRAANKRVLLGVVAARKNDEDNLGTALLAQQEYETLYTGTWHGSPSGKMQDQKTTDLLAIHMDRVRVQLDQQNEVMRSVLQLDNTIGAVALNDIGRLYQKGIRASLESLDADVGDEKLRQTSLFFSLGS